MAGFFRNLKLCMMFNLLFILVYFFQLHLKDFFLSQVARLFGRWFILGSLILTVCHSLSQWCGFYHSEGGEK